MTEVNGADHGSTPPATNKRALLARMLTERANAPRTYPVSSGQQRLWFLDRFQPGDPVYNIPVAFRLRGPLDVEALRAALELIVRRHGALRTSFADSGGEPVQVVRPTADPVLEVTDLSGGTAEEAARLVWQEARRPFDLAHGPLFRTRLVRTADDDHHLSLCLHHIVSDAWSLGVLFTELNTAYAALREGRTPQLPELPAQYADYALWQREKLAGEALRDQLDYWLGQLRGAPALLTLPTDRPRPAAQSYRGAVHYFDFGAALLRRLREFNQASGATTFMTLMAGFSALLSRSSGQDELVIGTPVAGRNHADLEPLIGFFVNTLPLRVSVAGVPTFGELVDRVREATLGGLAHADVPFEKLVEELAPERSLGHAPVFQTQLIVQNTPPANLDLTDLTSTSLRVDSGTAKFDLSLVGEMTSDGGLHLAVEYDTALFDAESVARLARQLTTLLDAALTDPDRPVAEIPLLAGVERWRSVVDWNATARGLPPVASVLELLPVDDSEAGPVPAVSGPDGAVNPAGLHERAAGLAYVLRARGVRPDTPVGICLDRGVGMLVGVLGTWHAGAGYLPLDPSLPADRLRYLLDDSGARVVVTQRSVRERLADLLADVPVVVCLDDDAAELAAAPTDADPVPAHPDGLAYLIYTSGSTGRPKGVAVPHRSVLNLIASFHDDLGLTGADRFAAVTTLSFDISVLELLVPLVTGTPLTIVDSAVAGDGPALRELLVADGITAMQATPATWRLLLATGGVPAGLRLRLCGGEALPRDLADALLADGAMLWNCYGPTETTVWSAATPVAPSPATIDLGTPIANTELYVLDRIGQPVPVGVVGEVHIGGHGVVRGYPGRPGLTASRFVPDPFSGRPGARLYATGDLARQRADGRLEFLGRTDHQVKIRGFRIELGEIEEQLRAHDLVADAVVSTWAAGSDDTRLVAYVVPTGAPTPDLWAVLRPWLATRLPGYMVPATLVTLTALPVNANGKTDRGALPQPDWRDAVTAERVAPRDPVEQLLAEIWQQVLRVERLGVHDDFFALGGHSLLAAQALSRIGAAFELELPIRVLFEAPTVAAMADALVAREPVPGHVVTVAELRQDLAGLSTEELRTLLGEPS
ncbi:amino acid adenylation domain-containing protein [Micromonospora pisi]|uniref:Amino acid adenylation domain-containing protein n=1 Tax=Micromonospora pisi TaxID=589240 RepID=A0A495JF40_9ACTN|nr:non-ribosomal peptide synthetase [Micromonospora pisi]RKR87004.1 amino acid adenylation domain-containing protein [Micromonospora pisi]